LDGFLAIKNLRVFLESDSRLFNTFLFFDGILDSGDLVIRVDLDIDSLGTDFDLDSNNSVVDNDDTAFFDSGIVDCLGLFNLLASKGKLISTFNTLVVLELGSDVRNLVVGINT
jgi:hypothetical protein